MSDDDRTRVKPEGTAADERTRMKPTPTAATPGTAAANLKGAAANDEATRLKPRQSPPAQVAEALPHAAARAPASAPLDTGSNWEHPEAWHSRDDATLSVGSVVKQRFELESVLGQGGMGVVYRALDRRKQEAQDRDPYVAVKVLGEEFRRHPNALIALQREARKAQTLAHPNVITVHDFDRDGTTVYMTMELLDGEPLNKVIAANKLRGLPPEKVIPMVRGMAEALAYAHKNGIVHSDFKPGNVFLTRKGDVKVLDFGIARAVPTDLQPNADQTVFDAAELGALTPPYASLEMLQGLAPAPADDVFALGIVAHELLTGRHPFDKTPADVAAREGLKPIGDPGLPRRQRKALEKALAFERDARHVDARAFLKDFEGPSAGRKTAYAATLVLMAGVAAYGFYSSNQIRPDVPFAELPQQVQQQFETAIAEAEQALRFGDIALNEGFEYYSRAYAIHRNNPRAISGLETVADRFLAVMPETDAGLRRNVLKKLYCQEYLGTYTPVLRACADTLGAQQCTFVAMGCTSVDQSP